MPIWFELIILLLATYTVGLGIGWAIFGRPSEIDETKDDGDSET